MSLFIESMSESRGTPLRVVFPSAMRVAAMIGSAEFLLPETSILPFKRFPPRTMKESIAPILGSIDPRGSISVAGVGQHDARRQPIGVSASPLADDQSITARQTCPFIGRHKQKFPQRPSGDIVARWKMEFKVVGEVKIHVSWRVAKRLTISCAT